VTQFTSTGLPLKPEDINELQGQESLERDVKDAVERTSKWLRQDAPLKPFSYHRATQVFRLLIDTRSGRIHQLLDTVMQDRRSEATNLASDLQRWRDRRVILDVVRQVEREHPQHPKPREIEAKALEQLLGAIREAVELASEWGHAVQRWEKGRTQRDWLHEQIQALAIGMNATLPAAKAAMQELLDDANPAVRAIAGQLLATLCDLECLTRGVTPSHELPQNVSRGICAGLAFRLLLLPELDLSADPNGTPCLTSSGVQDLPKILSQDRVQTKPIGTVIQRWIDKEDFRWVDHLIATVTSEPEKARIIELVATAREEHRRSIEDRLSAVKEKVEQSVLDGTTDPNERSRLESQLEKAHDELEMASPDFRTTRKRLDDVEQAISANRQLVLSERREKWNRLQSPVYKLLDKSSQVRLAITIDGALQRGDIYLADEVLAAVERSLDERARDSVEKLLSSWEEPEQSHGDDLTKFIQDRPRLLDLAESPGIIVLEQAARERDKNKKPLELADRHLPEPRWQEIAQVLSAWRSLKHDEGSSKPDLPLSLWTIMRYLGFVLRPDSREAFRKRASGRGWSHWEVTMSGEPLAGC